MSEDRWAAPVLHRWLRCLVAVVVVVATATFLPTASAGLFRAAKPDPYAGIASDADANQAPVPSVTSDDPEPTVRAAGPTSPHGLPPMLTMLALPGRTTVPDSGASQTSPPALTGAAQTRAPPERIAHAA